MKIEIHPNLLPKDDIDILMAEINPKETATPMKYFGEVKENSSCKKVTCTDHHLIKILCNKFPYKTESVSIVYYPTNSYNPPHADNCNLPDGYIPYTQNQNIKKVNGWSHTGIIFLNDNFEGGKLIYPYQGCVFLPTIGTMIITPAGEDYIHFVEHVTKGERFTLVFRFVQ